MQEVISIRDQLTQFIKDENITMSKFAKKVGMNVGIISSAISGSRVLSTEQIDNCTSIMQLEEGSLYEQYIEEYLNEASPDWRRIKPFLVRCAELHKLNCIEQVVSLLADQLMYASLMFDLAEELFYRDKKSASAILYESVSMSENKQHSERLAICQYRLFIAKQGDDQEENYQLAIRFEPFVERLDEVDQLDALKELANMYRSLQRWDKVEKTSQIMLHKAEIQYELKQQGKSITNKKPKRPWFFYISYAYLLLGSSCDEWHRDYKKALKYTDLYSNLSWVQENDPNTLLWKNNFKSWAESNNYVYKLLSGDISVIDTYLKSIENEEDEIMVFLLNVVEASNRFNFNIKDIILKFKNEISNLEKKTKSIDIYTHQTNLERYSRFLYELALYYLRSGSYDNGFNKLLESLKQAYLINNKTCIIKCVGLFEKFRINATNDTKKTYQTMINEVYKYETKI
ncbi:transcriptional regulator [Paenibacillus sp. PsM32]|uniref:transcriptional regulator n=1 Tax=Paenibacillus sp. PsM32 TaxID=3030536 RepID=UPI00263B8238|nr:transcriptional regulator [Paenibacillus sp. PsM32]MDN4620254.1 transcriptional regulator [Paenibacillus sp. PsM32]